jgi:hypothetical protein
MLCVTNEDRRLNQAHWVNKSQLSKTIDSTLENTLTFQILLSCHDLRRCCTAGCSVTQLIAPMCINPTFCNHLGYLQCRHFCSTFFETQGSDCWQAFQFLGSKRGRSLLLVPRQPPNPVRPIQNCDHEAIDQNS